MRPHRQQPIRLPRPWGSPGKNTGVGCHFLLQCMKVKSASEVAQSCLTLSDPVDCSLPDPSIHGIFQARVLEWLAIAFSRNNWLHTKLSKNCWYSFYISELHYTVDHLLFRYYIMVKLKCLMITSVPISLYYLDLIYLFIHQLLIQYLFNTKCWVLFFVLWM